MRNNGKISLNWIRSMVLLVLLILCLSSLLLGYNIATIRGHILKHIISFSEYIQNTLDSRFYEIQRYSTVLELHETNSLTKKLIRTPDSISTDHYAYSDLLSNYKLSNTMLAGISIYYKNADLIIGDKGVYRSFSYYALVNNLDTSGYHRWIGDIEDSHTGFRRLKVGDGYQYCFIKSMMHRSKVVGYIIFHFDTEELLRVTEGMTSSGSTSQAFGIILDGEVLSDKGHKELFNQLLKGVELEPGESKNITTNNYILYIKPSGLRGVHFVSAYSLPDTLRPLVITLIISVIGVVGIGILGTALSIRIGRKNTEPLTSILQKLGYDSLQDLNEYELINNNIDTLYREKNIRINKLQSQQDIIEGLFLNMVLNTEFETERVIFNAAKRYDIVFENPYYLIAIIKYNSKESESIHREIRNYCESLGLDMMLTYINGKYILLFNPEEEIDHCSLVPKIERLLAGDFWKGHYPASLGRCYDSLKSIRQSYMEAMTVLNQVQAVAPGRAVCYSKEMDGRLNKSYSLHFERFTDTFTQGQYDEARKSFELFFAQCCIINDTAAALESVFSSLRPLFEERALREKIKLDSIAKDFFVFSSPRQLNQNVLEFLDRLARPPVRDEVSSVAEKAKAIISRDFTDSMLGLYRISEDLGVSNSYLSSTFKNTYGIGVIQYINQLRINLAKELILNTDMSIKDIAVAVGFSSDISFIRVFKKYESKTPNTLRKEEG